MNVSPAALTLRVGEAEFVALSVSDQSLTDGFGLRIDDCGARGITSTRLGNGGATITALKSGKCFTQFQLIESSISLAGERDEVWAELTVTVSGDDDAGAPSQDASAPDADTDASSPDAGDAADAGDGGDGGPGDPVARLYVSDRAGNTVRKFHVFPGTIAASSSGSFTSAEPTGMAFGPASILYVGNGATGGIERWASVKTTPTQMSALAAPATPPNWSPSGVLFVPTAAGAGELWVASAAFTDVLTVYTLDATGAVVAGPTTVATNITSAAGDGIQGLAFDGPSNSLFVAADRVRRLTLARIGSGWTLTPATDEGLTLPGAGTPTGLVMGPNRWLYGTYRNPSAVSLAYWSFDGSTSSFVNGASGAGGSYNPLAITILPTQAPASPVRVYTTTSSNQVIAVDALTAGVPAVDSFVCNAPAPSWIVAGD